MDDGVSITDDYGYIYGWMIKPGCTLRSVKMHVVLKNTETGKYYVVPTNIVERKDITEMMNDGNVYDRCGFWVSLPRLDELDQKDRDYEIYALYELNDEECKLIPFQNTLKKRTKEIISAE